MKIISDADFPILQSLPQLKGGLPQVALHAYEKLGAPLGTASSHGCIRMRQATLNRLLKLLTAAPRS